jgi:two-component system LytT family response regulator
MKKRSVLLIDPDESHRQQINEVLKSYRHFCVVANCSNVLEGMRYINALEPELVLMDIDLPGGNGFNLLSETSHLPAVIFTTRTDAYAYKAFEYNAIDYLLKPLRKERLEAALDKYLRMDSKQHNEGFSGQHQEIVRPNRILVESGKRHKSLSMI